MGCRGALTVAANTLVINTEALADGLDEAQVSFVIAAEDEPGELVKEAEMVFGQLREHAGLDPVGGRLLAFIAVRGVSVGARPSEGLRAEL